MRTTTTLFQIIMSELYKQGFNNEVVNSNGELVFFDNDQQNMKKIMMFDDNVKQIINKLFLNNVLDNRTHDDHFKKMFTHKFLNRELQHQTIELFMMDVSSTFLMKENYINTVYNDLEKYLNKVNENAGTSNNNSSGTNTTKNTGETTTDDRSAFSDLPNDTLTFDLNNESFFNPSNADARKNRTNNTNNSDNKTTNNSHSSDERITKTYSLDELFKINNIEENILKDFDRKCFLQTW